MNFLFFSLAPGIYGNRNLEIQEDSLLIILHLEDASGPRFVSATLLSKDSNELKRTVDLRNKIEHPSVVLTEPICQM